MHTSRRGFTLIELMVVIGIIGVLASIVITAGGASRAKSRDAKRIDAMRQIASMLDVYYQENGHYPVSAGTATDCGNSTGTNWIPNTGDADPYAWSSSYISEVPRDPSPSCSSDPSADYSYTSADGSSYVLMARLEDANNPKTIKNSNALNCTGAAYYPTYNANTYVIGSC